MDISIRPRADRRWRLIFLLVAGVYLAINLGFPKLRFIDGNIKSYLIQPLLWALVVWLVFRLPQYRAAGKPRMKSSIIQLGLMIGFFQVMLYAISGLFCGFGKSPSSFKPFGILTNIFLVSAMLLGMEMSRAWLINHLGKRSFIALAFVALLYTVLSLPLSQILGIKLEVQSINFLNSTLLPALSESLLASLLALLAGPWASIGYRGMLQAFWWFCPILPDLSWAFKGLVGTAVPVTGLMFVRGFYVSETQRSRAKQEEGSLGGWVLTTVTSVVLIWFSVGVFPIRPALVGSGSMSPMMEAGDIVLVAKISTDSIKVDDVIQFKKPEKITIVHRVIEIQEAQGAKFFITKGDANDAPDTEPVIPANVIGRVFFTIRKIGWLSIIVKKFFGG